MRSKTFFVCSYDGCSAQYNRKDRLKIHMRRHTGQRPFPCVHPNCDKSYIRAEHLKRHKLIHDKSNIKCPYENCDVTLKTPATLKKHVNNFHIKLKNSPYKCSHCNKEFHKHSLLKTHENKHQSSKRYKCPHEGCQKSFMTPSKLLRHSKVHKGYECTHAGCNEISETWILHLKHLKFTHPNEYKCPICFRVFNNHRNMKNHQITHVNPFKRQFFICPEPNCDKIYFAVKNLRHHIKTYHKDYFESPENSFPALFEDYFQGFSSGLTITPDLQGSDQDEENEGLSDDEEKKE